MKQTQTLNTKEIKIRDLQYVMTKHKQHLEDCEGWLLNYRKTMLYYLSNNRTIEFNMCVKRYFDCLKDRDMTMDCVIRLQQNILLLGGSVNG